MSAATSLPLFPRFFSNTLAETDPEIAEAIQLELGRQQHEIELIASENIVSKGRARSAGLDHDQQVCRGVSGQALLRRLPVCGYRRERWRSSAPRQLFGANFANVQPNSGSQMNQAVFLALLEPGDTFMGLDLNSGGHLTHGSPVNMSGKWFKVVSYGVRQDDHLLDMDEVARLAREHKPKLILAGGTAYSRVWDWARFREIADEVGAYLMVDMAHIAGLVAGGVHPSPVPHAHVVTTTTHKSLRGPRGGMILSNDEAIAKKINSAVFPGLQGGPLMHVIAAKAVAFKEALQPEFKAYARQVVANARTLAATLIENGLDVVSGGTDNHLMLVDLRKKNATGKRAEAGLGRAYITCNKNGIPFDPEKPFVTSGVRLGTPAATSRGFGEAEFREIGKLIVEVLDGLREANSDEGNAAVEAAVRDKVMALTSRFPIYAD
jgi:glycine hydroxymethyltransferase